MTSKGRLSRAWDDLRIEPVARTTGNNAPAFEKWLDDVAGTSRGVYLYSFDDAALANEKEIFFTMQLPHAWAITPIHIHVHWMAESTAASSAVRWGLEFAWKEPFATYADTTIIYASVPEGGDTGTTQYKHMITEFAEQTPGTSQDDVSSIIVARLFRNSSHADDTYAGKVGLLYIDTHIEIDSLGSITEYAK